jgi:hypothetical protein
MAQRLKDDITHFYNIGIKGIIPISHKYSNSKADVRYGKNNKYDFKPDGIKHSTINNIELNDIIEEINKGICGFCIRTGEINNITGIDVDNNGLTLNDNTILDILFKLNTLTIKSPNGYHFYFNHEPTLLNNIHLFNNIDIRNNNGILFYGDRKDGKYEIINKTDIKHLSTDLIEKFKNYKKPLHNTTTELTKINDINIYDLDDKILNDKWFITKKALYEILM